MELTPEQKIAMLGERITFTEVAVTIVAGAMQRQDLLKDAEWRLIHDTLHSCLQDTEFGQGWRQRLAGILAEGQRPDG